MPKTHTTPFNARSSNSDQIMMPSYNLTIIVRRAFPVFATNLWKSLPVSLTLALSLTIFCKRLKTQVTSFGVLTLT